MLASEDLRNFAYLAAVSSLLGDVRGGIATITERIAASMRQAALDVKEEVLGRPTKAEEQDQVCIIYPSAPLALLSRAGSGMLCICNCARCKDKLYIRKYVQ